MISHTNSNKRNCPMVNIDFAPLLEVFDWVSVHPTSLSGGLKPGFSGFL
jgi:hypothetical protein